MVEDSFHPGAEQEMRVHRGVNIYNLEDFVFAVSGSSAEKTNIIEVNTTNVFLLTLPYRSRMCQTKLTQ